MADPAHQLDGVTVYRGDSLQLLRAGRDLGYDYELGYEEHRLFPDNSVDAVVTDPPYGLEFMGKDWDAPWSDPDINADAGFAAVQLADGAKRLPRPTYTGSTNPKCSACGGTRRGRRDGTAARPVCLCEDGGRFPNVRSREMRAFQDWAEQWSAECLRVLKPGGHMLAFGGSRTWHRLACAVEDAGFEVRDSIAWLYGTGFPKSLDVAKAIDKAAGAERAVVGPSRWNSVKGVAGRHGGLTPDGYVSHGGTRHDETAPATEEARRWQGWGTALKPAFEPIIVARKPLAGTVAANVLAHGTGALNIDGCRVATDDVLTGSGTPPLQYGGTNSRPFHADAQPRGVNQHVAGRWPPNVVLDESQAEALDRQAGTRPPGRTPGSRSGLGFGSTAQGTDGDPVEWAGGGASRFFPTFRYEAKASAAERPKYWRHACDCVHDKPMRPAGVCEVCGRPGELVAHPTVKPLDLIRWLVRLVTPLGGLVLDPFAGSGTTAEACLAEGMECVLIEQEADYLPLIQQRLDRTVQPGLFGLALDT